MRNIKTSSRIWLSLVICLVFVTSTCFAFVSSQSVQVVISEEVGMSSAHLQKIDRILQKMIDDGETKGVLAAVARKGKFVYLKAFGEMDEGKPMEVDTIFRICSQSKLVTNVGLMMLFEEGLFRLNDPISKYIPEFKETKVLVEDKSVSEGYKLVPPKREITIRDLITHTSGISYAFWGRPIIAEWYVKEGVSDGLVTTEGTMADNIKKLAKCPLLFHPGEAYEYGLNTDVLGYLIEILSGMPLDKFFEERIFKPLGMVDTYFYLPEEKVSRLAAIYESDGNGGVRKIEERVYKGPSIFSPELNTNVYDGIYPYTGPKTYFSGGAGLSSTIIDYARLCQMLVNKGELDGKRVLSPFTVDFMLNTKLILDNDIAQWLVRQGWYTTMGGITLENPGAGGYFAAPGSFSWAGYYRTDYEFDVENELIFILFTQRVVYMDQSEEFDLLRIISHGAILSK